MSSKSFLNFLQITGALVLILGIMGRGSTVPSGVAIHAAEAHGFTDARVVDRSNFWAWANGCGEYDAVAFSVTAKRDGRPVSLVVCSGAWTKGATVRVR